MKHRLSILFAGLALIAVSAVSVCSFAGKKVKRLEPFAFYEACKAYYEGVVSKNWKDRDKARDKISEDARGYAEPVVSWQLAMDGLMGGRLEGDVLKASLDADRDRLQAASHPEFHDLEKYRPYPDFIKDGFRNDYEYLLWTLAKSYTWGDDREYVSRLLKEYLDGRYPASAYLEYTEIPYGDERKAALDSFARKYDGKAVALVAKGELLRIRKNEIRTSDGFKELRRECAELEKQRSSYKGEEAAVAKEADAMERLIEELDSKAIRQYIDEDTVSVLLRNLDGVEVELLKGEGDDRRSLWKTSLTNGRHSYFVFDTLKFVLPAMDDGQDYVLLCRSGKVESKGRLSRSSVSLASRSDGDGFAVYAADARTGKPVGQADLILKYKGEILKTVEDFGFDGFTPLGEELLSFIRNNKGTTALSCSYRDGDGLLRESNEIYLYDSGKVSEGTDPRVNDAEIFLDRAAYNPGDTLRFKAVLYMTDMQTRQMSVLSGNQECTVTVTDAERREVVSETCVTNGFGSVSGEIVLPQGMSKNGRFSISVAYGGKPLDSAFFIVDEFVLPTYTISFDKDETYHYPGDTVKVSGRVTSYTGHPLSSATVAYSVSYGDFMQDGRIVPEADGAFGIIFVSGDEDPADYKVSVKVVDITGETAEAWKYVRAGSHLYMTAEMEDEAEGQVDIATRQEYGYDWYGSTSIVTQEKPRVKFCVNSIFVPDVPKELEYRVMYGKEQIASGKSLSGEYVTVDLEGYPSGLYEVEAKSSYTTVSGKNVEIGYIKKLIKLSDVDTALYAGGVKNLFSKIDDGGRIGVRFGTTEGPVWALAELYDDKGNVLESDKVYLDGKEGRPGSLRLIDYAYKEEYPDAVTFRIFYFKDEDAFEYYTEFRRPEKDWSLPLEFVRFTDNSVPGGLAEFRVRTLPGVECLVSVFDKSTESVMRNVWQKIFRRGLAAERNRLSSAIGYTRLRNTDYRLKDSEEAIPFQLAENKPVASKAMSLMASEDAYVDTFAGDLADMDAGVAVRDDFRETIAFLPFLRSDKDGYIDFSVVPSGKLSTYYVSLFAHDREMRNAMLRREMTVTLPVKVSVMEPGFLYEGDRYRLKASVSNVGDRPVEGMLTMYVYDTGDYKDAEPIAVKSSLVRVGAGQAGAEEFEVKVPSGADVLGFKVVFSADADGTQVSDGLFVKVPVKPAAQELVEAHSAVLTDSANKEALVDSLEKAFVNISAMGAEYREISLRDMLLELLPEAAEAECGDVLSCADAYYSNRLLVELGQVSADEALMQDLMTKIHDCQNTDGGFGWFAGMKSSPYITAAILEMAHGDGTMLDNVRIGKAIGYLDARQSGDEEWGGLSLGQYLNVRSMYPEIPFDVNAGKEEMSGFRNEVREWLRPKDEGAERHYILERARRASVKLNLAAPEAEALRKAWKLGSGKSLLRSVRKEAEVLAEYAVKHPSGGYYFPNAVMPFRGLLESELYAHTMLCGLFCRLAYMPEVGFDVAGAGAVADGLRLWMMVQKETQQWENDPAYVDAVAAVLSGSEKVLDTKVVTLTKRFLKPFREIDAAGNGLRISRKYYKVTGQVQENGYKDMPAIEDGDVLSVGDRIVAVYEVWSQENRSFVRISAPRPASLRPVQQLSGITGWAYRPFAMPGGKMMIYPQGYRNVRTDRTELYFDVLPEENTVFTEEFHVTQSGKFTSPVITVESLYAPHYRANDAFSGEMAVE